jgi:hypothetical protein
MWNQAVFKGRYGSIGLVISAFLLILGASLMMPQGNVAQVATLHRFWVSSAILGGGFILSWPLRNVPAIWFWGVAITTRLILLPMAPGDDIWRYLWEGFIQNHGFSPYHFAPNAPELTALRTSWWPLINHPDVSAIYPPLTQLGFRLLAAISPSVLLFKLAFVIPDLWVSGLLCRRFGNAAATLYAWNPVVIYSFAGGGHYDSWFILPLVAAWLASESNPSSRSSPGWSALWLGFSVAVKWISLPLLVFLLKQSLRQRRFRQAVGVGVLGVLPMILLALPFCNTHSCPLIPTRSVFVSYGRSAEFIPHWIAKIWPLSLTANWIYSIPLVCLVLGLLWTGQRFQRFAEGYWFGLLLLTPIIHFWYFTWIVPFAVPSRNWGVRWVSLSAFVYFVLPSRIPDWRLTEPERLFLWLPFVLGWVWSYCSHQQRLRVIN